MTERRFKSVRDLIRAISATPEEAQEAIDDLDNHSLSRLLVVLRYRHGLSQKQLAQKAGWTQGKISKLEHQVNGAISVGDLSTYAAALGMSLEIGFTNVTPGKLADRVKYHFMKMQAALDEINKIADGDDEIQRAGKPFMNEVMNNLFIALQKCEQTVRASSASSGVPKRESGRLIVTSDLLDESGVAVV